MIVRAIGFFIDLTKLPPAMSCSDAFESLKEHGVSALDPKGRFHVAAEKIVHTYRDTEREWWVGIILRVRDAKKFSKLVKRDGSVKMSPDQLAEGDIAEASYFLASATTGKGLLACYHGSPYIPAFQWALRKVFKARQATRRENAKQQAATLTEKKNAAKAHEGSLVLGSLVRTGNLKQLMKEFRRVHTVEIKVAAVEENARFLGKAEPETVTRTEKYTFPANFAFGDGNDDLADEIVDIVQNNPEAVASISGTSAVGTEKISSVEMKNPQVFGHQEYDILHESEYEFEQSAEGSNIAESPVVDWLKRLLNGARTHGVLTTN